jgi:hypothetical protein
VDYDYNDKRKYDEHVKREMALCPNLAPVFSDVQMRLTDIKILSSDYQLLKEDSAPFS